MEHGRRAPMALQDVLLPVSPWFPEGFDTTGIQEVQARLDELMYKRHRSAAAMFAIPVKRGEVCGALCAVCIWGHSVFP